MHCAVDSAHYGLQRSKTLDKQKQQIDAQKLRKHKQRSHFETAMMKLNAAQAFRTARRSSNQFEAGHKGNYTIPRFSVLAGPAPRCNVKLCEALVLIALVLGVQKEHGSLDEW